MRPLFDVMFGMLWLSGAVAGVVFLMVLHNLVDPQGEGAFGIYSFGMFSFIPTVLAWICSGLPTIFGTPGRDVRLVAAVTTGHLVWWAAAVGLLTSLGDGGPRALVTIALLEPGLYAAAAIYLPMRWLRTRRELMMERS